MSTVKEHITEIAAQNFLIRGFKSVTVDDIVQEVGISKKTLYEHFGNKNELIAESLNSHFLQMSNIIEQIKNSSDNAISSFWEVFDCNKSTINRMHPHALKELQKYYPKSFQSFLEHKNNFSINLVRDNIILGISQGLYRSDIDPDILSRYQVESTYMLVKNGHELFPHKEAVEILIPINQNFFLGMLTDEGRKQYSKYLKKLQAN